MNLDLDDVIENVSKDFATDAGNIDYSYQSEKWYTTAVTACRAVNLLLCFVLITCFTAGGF